MSWQRLVCGCWRGRLGRLDCGAQHRALSTLRHAFVSDITSIQLPTLHRAGQPTQLATTRDAHSPRQRRLVPRAFFPDLNAWRAVRTLSVAAYRTLLAGEAVVLGTTSAGPSSPFLRWCRGGCHFLDGFIFRCSHHGVTMAHTSGNARVIRSNTSRYGKARQQCRNEAVNEYGR